MKKKIVIKNILSDAWKIFSEHWWKMILAFLLVWAVSFILGQFSLSVDPTTGLSSGHWVFNIIGYIASVYFGMGIIRYTLNLVDGEGKFTDIFKGPQTFLHALVFVGTQFVLALGGLIALGIPAGLGILALAQDSTILSIVGVILLVAAGIGLIILSLGFSQLQYVVVDEYRSFFDNLKRAWIIAKPYLGDIFIFGWVLIFLNLAGVIAFGVGLLVTIPWTTLMTIMYYRQLRDIADNTITVEGESTEDIDSE